MLRGSPAPRFSSADSIPYRVPPPYKCNSPSRFGRDGGSRRRRQDPASVLSGETRGIISTQPVATAETREARVHPIHRLRQVGRKLQGVLERQIAVKRQGHNICKDNGHKIGGGENLSDREFVQGRLDYVMPEPGEKIGLRPAGLKSRLRDEVRAVGSVQIQFVDAIGIRRVRSWYCNLLSLSASTRC